MNQAEELGERIAKFVAARCNVTVGTREDIKRFVVREVAPHIPLQAVLSFEDAEALKGQSREILNLLRSRGLNGATNAELSEIGLNYTARLSELRQQGFVVLCHRIGGSRTFNYTLRGEMNYA